MRAGVGWGAPPSPPCLALFRHFQREGGGVCGNGFEFQANLREGARDGRGRSRGQRRFLELLNVRMLRLFSDVTYDVRT